VSIASSIRLFFDELFASRLTERLQEDLLQLRSDYDYRLQDKDAVIAELRSEKAQMQAKMTEYELTLMPRSSKAGADYVRTHVKPEKPNFGFDFSAPPPISKWQAMVDAHEAEMAAEQTAEDEKKEEIVKATA